MSTYIVIEINEKENALDIMNILMTHTKTRFIVTNDIQEYAQEREKLKAQNQLSNGQKEESIVPAKKPFTDQSLQSPENNISCSDQPPAESKETSPDCVEIEEPPVKPDFRQLVPKTEEPSPSYYDYNGIAEFHDQHEPLDPFQIRHNPGQFAQFFNQSWNPEQINDFPMLSQARRGRPRTEGSAGLKYLSESYPCAMCGADIRAIGLDYIKRSDHAIIHTELRRYICPAENCGLKSRHRSNMSAHINKKHPELRGTGVISCMNQEDEEELKQMTLKCFPELGGQARKRDRRPNRSAEFEDDTVVEEAVL